MTWEPLLHRLAQLQATWPSPPWTWDARFAAVASTFTAAQEPAIRASAQLAFPRGWTTSSLVNAPADLQAFAARTGGLRANQRLLGGDPVSCASLFGLWWPWGSGDKITLRIGIVGIADDAPPLPQLRALFGLAR